MKETFDKKKALEIAQKEFDGLMSAAFAKHSEVIRLRAELGEEI